MTTSFRVTCFVVLLTILSCGKKASDPVGTTTTSGNTRAVIKSGTTTVAYVISWAEHAEIVNVYIPSVERYATINLYTGTYASEAGDSSHVFLFSSADCSGNAIAVNDTFIGQSLKTIVYDQVGDKYYLVTGHAESNTYNSSQNARTGSSFSASGGTDTRSYGLTISTRPYNFEVIAPLTISYE